MTTAPTHTARFAQAISDRLMERILRIKKSNFDFLLAEYGCFQLSHDVWILHDKAGNIFPVKSKRLVIESKRTSEPNQKPEKPRIRVRGTVRQAVQGVSDFPVQIAV